MNQQKKFLIQQIGWIAGGFAIGLAISSILPFPYALGAMMVVFLAISYAVRFWAIRRIKRAYSSAASFSSNMLRSDPLERKLEFRCTTCGTSHKLRECPKCGSKAVRAG
ncbi:MAG: hypothetical protein HRF40_09080 [Nitrososphaera sp.]